MGHEVTWQEVDALKVHLAVLEKGLEGDRPSAIEGVEPPLHCPGCDGDHP